MENTYKTERSKKAAETLKSNIEKLTKEERKAKYGASKIKPWNELSLCQKCKRLKICMSTFVKYSNGDTSFEYMSKWADERHSMTKGEVHSGIYNGQYNKQKSQETIEKMKETKQTQSQLHFDLIKQYEDEGKYATSDTLSKKIGCGKTTFERFYRGQHSFNLGKKHMFNVSLAEDSPLIGLKAKGISHYEQEIEDFIKSIYCGTVERNTRKVINPKELDIYIPEKSLAIEYNGLYWHSQVDKNFHLQKTLLCEEKNIRLMHIFEDEWRDKKEIVKSMIASALGVYKQKIYARKCEVTKVPKPIALQFCKENHIHGASLQDYAFYGLTYKGNLAQVITIRKNFAQRTTDKEPELGRMCTLLNTQVVGGFSKLIKYALNDLNIKYIDSFVDRRLFNANGYLSSGWTITGESGSSYCYTDGTNRFNRQQYMKKSCLSKWPESDKNKTERQICAEHGLYPIFDCGNLKLRYTLK